MALNTKVNIKITNLNKAFDEKQHKTYGKRLMQEVLDVLGEPVLCQEEAVFHEMKLPNGKTVEVICPDIYISTVGLVSSDIDWNSIILKISQLQLFYGIMITVCKTDFKSMSLTKIAVGNIVE